MTCVVRAIYDGRCPSCDEPIYEGDDIANIDGEWLCADCAEESGEELQR
jgi:formylmethanofuran dehydrogenase subunit E